MNPHYRISQVRDGYGRGWSFTPLTGKKPVLWRWQEREREPLYQALRWARSGNIGLRTGRNSGVVVVDVDKGADISELCLPLTVTVTTGSGGQHLYYRADRPVRNSHNKLAPHVDVRGDGGQVVFPGSIHPETGKTYTWAPGKSPSEVPMAELPDYIH